MLWIETISRGIDYMEEHLTEELKIEEVAKLANCSVGHFQKVFSYITGITLSEYIRQRRMTLAGFELKQGKQKVIDVANKYGYSSPTAFNRSFKSVHGISPSKAANSQSILNSYAPIKFSIQLLGGDSLKYKIENKPGLRLVGVRIPLKYEINEDMQNVPKFWEEVLASPIYSQLCDLADSDALYGITDTTDKDKSYYYIGVETQASLPADLVELQLPAAKRVVFENQGRFKESVQQTFKRFLLEWLPFSNYDYEGSPDVEVYPINQENLQTGHSEMWIAIKEEK